MDTKITKTGHGNLDKNDYDANKDREIRNIYGKGQGSWLFNFFCSIIDVNAVLCLFMAVINSVVVMITTVKFILKKKPGKLMQLIFFFFNNKK